MTPQEMITKLSKFYWSPRPPETYLIPHPTTGVQVGLGRIVHKSYAAFNLTYAYVGGKLQDVGTQARAVKVFSFLQDRLEVPVAGADLSSWVTLLTQPEFTAWAAANTDSIPLELRNYMPGVLNVRKVL